MAKWRIGLAALTLLVLGLVPPALAQTYAPTFDLVVSGTIVQVTHDQTFDYGAHPPGASITAQLHNGPNPECVFTATRSDTGASQYQNIGGSNGYDTSGRYTDPPPVVDAARRRRDSPGNRLEPDRSALSLSLRVAVGLALPSRGAAWPARARPRLPAVLPHRDRSRRAPHRHPVRGRPALGSSR